jgi:hypothetical protein
MILVSPILGSCSNSYAPIAPCPCQRRVGGEGYPLAGASPSYPLKPIPEADIWRVTLVKRYRAEAMQRAAMRTDQLLEDSDPKATVSASAYSARLRRSRSPL